MNIAKHKEILALRDELASLEKEYKEKQSKIVDLEVDKLLSAAVKEFIEYVKAEGFEVTGDEKGNVVANLEGMEIRLDRKSRIFTVYMPNREEYSVMVETTLEYANSYVPGEGTQDVELERLKKAIDKVNNQFSLLENQEFRYVLGTDQSNYRVGFNYFKRPYVNFKDILGVMFS
jgi:hypothetical protein